MKLSRHITLSTLRAGVGTLIVGLTLPALALDSSTTPSYVLSAIDRAGANRQEISRAWAEVPADQKSGMAYLLEHMPEHDLRSLDADFLLENVGSAYRAWQNAPWSSNVSEELFLNEILPYCLVTEDRTAWRELLRKQCLEMVDGAETPTDAVIRLNQELFPEFGVVYSTERSRTDQNVLQVLEEQKATCTGLSVLLTSACRSVGIPARLAGTPLWADSSGNHSWVEIWDDGWRFTGAAEPKDQLNDAWFTNRASRARKEIPVHAVYATSYARTGTTFPIAWDESVEYVAAINVTDRYTRADEIQFDRTPLRIVAFDADLRRVPTRVEVHDNSGRLVFTGTTRTDRSDLNDHLTATLDPDREYRVVYRTHAQSRSLPFRTAQGGEPMTLRLKVRAQHEWGRPDEDRARP